MKRDFLKDLGLDDEKVEQVMKSYGQNVSEAQKKAKAEADQAAKVEADKLRAELEGLRGLSAELEKLKAEGMSAEEKLKAAEGKAEAERLRYLRLQSEAKATAILAAAGVAETALPKLLPGLVTEDLAVTEQRAADLAAVLGEATETASRAKEEELLKATPEPPAGAGAAAKADGNMAQQIEAALSAGSPSEAAYWTRIAQQQG